MFLLAASLGFVSTSIINSLRPPTYDGKSNRSRASPVLLKFFSEAFEGTLENDSWGAYHAVVCAWRQTCLVHLFLELEHTEKYTSPGKDRVEFVKTLRRVLQDGIRLSCRRREYDEATFASRRGRLA